ncbi:MAG TPA: hypothetical protein VIK20_01450 [Bacteroidales bacterium]
MLSESNLSNLPQAEFEVKLTDSSVEIVQDPRDKAKEDREDLVKTREKQAVTLNDSIQDFKMESLDKISQNAMFIAEFREKIPVAQSELVAKYHSKVNELNQKNSEMKTKLEEYKLESKGRWISFKYEYKHDLIALDKALKDLVIEDVI